MKELVTQYHVLNIAELARGQWLDPCSKYECVWATYKGTHQTTVTITVLTDALQLLWPMGVERVRQNVRLTYSLAPRGGKRPWFACPTCRRGLACCITRKGCRFVVGPAASWPIPLSIDREIRAMVVRPEW